MKQELLAPGQNEDRHDDVLLGRRWYILFVSSTIAFLQGWVWNTYGPIAVTVERQFGWNDAYAVFPRELGANRLRGVLSAHSLEPFEV